MKHTFDPMLLSIAAAAQAKALEPSASVWISANAGTGKTEVLTRRILTLLLADATLEPQHILALTFTKAGAAEMAARLPARLAAWSGLEEAELHKKVAEETGQTDVPNLAERVKNLSLAVRRAPPLVSTIHGLAQQVLGRFTLEAGLPQEFEVLEEFAQKRLLKEIQSNLLVNVSGPLADCLGTLLDELGEQSWSDLTGLIVNNWGRLEHLLAAAGGLPVVLARLQTALGLTDAATARAAKPLLPSPQQAEALQRIAHALPQHALAQVLTVPDALREAAWRDALLTNSGTPRKALFKKAEQTALDETDAALMYAAAEDLAECLRLRKVYRGFDVTRAALLWAAAVRGAYVQRKRQQGLADYTDLLDGFERLLHQAQGGAQSWVWYGLDRRFRHLVVDEAQDNNAQQDRIIRWLAQSILSGDVGEGTARTVLVVGDMKQSIFRFQGAVPELFLGLREMLRDWAPSVKEVDLVHSFRSSGAVLNFVDKVFADTSGQVVTGENPATGGSGWPNHAAVATRAGRVEVWPLAQGDEAPAVAPWSLPQVRHAAGGHGAEVRCLQQVATWLKAQVGRAVLPSSGKALEYGDVMLVVKRNRVAQLAAGVLRQAGVPVASGGGVQPQAVEDALACLRVAYNPADNLALAQVLKAVHGWNDAELLALAAKAQQAGGTATPWHVHLGGAAAATLATLQGLAWQPPLAAAQAAARLVGGDDTLYEGLYAWATQAATLHDLIARAEQEEPPVASSGSGVRILTVHGSKGLQAPLVIMPDTMTALADMSREKMLWAEDTLLMKQSKGLSELEDTLTEAESARRKADSLRELYVAMTRAMDWLVITGAAASREKSDTWYTCIRQGTEGWGTVDAAGVWSDGAEFPQTENTATETVTPPQTSLPEWLNQPLVPPQTATPQGEAQARGERVHALLQGLNIPAEADVRAEAAAVRNALPWLWNTGARSEVAVALPQGGGVGRIDRLVEHDGVLWIIDFKTGTVPSAMPPAYAEQVQAYARALRATWPQRSIKAAIVWTAQARLDEVATGC